MPSHAVIFPLSSSLLAAAVLNRPTSCTTRAHLSGWSCRNPRDQSSPSPFAREYKISPPIVNSKTPPAPGRRCTTGVSVSVSVSKDEASPPPLVPPLPSPPSSRSSPDVVSRSATSLACDSKAQESQYSSSAAKKGICNGWFQLCWFRRPKLNWPSLPPKFELGPRDFPSAGALV